MKKILITGASGFIGKNLIKSLSKKNYKIAVLDRSAPNNSNKLKNYIGDICDYNFVEKAILDFKPERVFHLAGFKLYF